MREVDEKFYTVKLTDFQVEALARPAGTQAETPGALAVPLLGAEPVPFPDTTPNAPAVTGRPPGRGGLGGGASGLPNLPSIPGTPQ